MCAIAGIVGFAVTPEVIEKMLVTMRRRGPDGKGVFQDNICTLLHTRLAIIDPQNGQQPMTLRWGKETYTISYNGELYNADELKSELQNCGHRFMTQCDTEILLHAYAQWREGCLEKLNGIYAFGVWESSAKRLFIARDRMGVKPIFYTLCEDGVIFASEIKTILAHPRIPAQLDQEGVAQILMLGPSRCPGSGVFHNINELKPGQFAIYENNRFHVHTYWSLCDGEHHCSFEETAEQVRWLVTDAIQRQTVSHVPIGTFLSGGLDSSIISAICAKKARENGNVLPTFSLDYQNNDKFFVPGKFQPTADNEFIKQMQDYIHSKHHDTVLTTKALIGAVEDATIARDLPGMADVDASLLAFSREIRQEVKVALSGECADEIFGGYPWYRDPEVRERDGFPWAQNTAQRAALLHPRFWGKFDPKEYVFAQYADCVNATDVLPGTDPLEKRMKQMVNLNHKWFMQTLLDRKDRMSMYWGLEVRVPFCDHRIAEYLYRVPWAYKDWQGREKGLLRKAMEDILPETVLWRKKSPYPKTFDPTYAKKIRKLYDEMCADPNQPIFQIVDTKALLDLPNSADHTPWYGQLMRLPQTMAYMLQINYWLKAYRVQLIV